MEILIGFSLGVGIVGIVMLGVFMFRLNRQLKSMRQELTEVSKSIEYVQRYANNIESDTYRRMETSENTFSVRLDELHRELHLRIDEMDRTFQSQLDSRLDKLEDKLSNKAVLKG